MAIGSISDRVAAAFSPELMREITEASTQDVEVYNPLYELISKLPGKDHATEIAHRQHDISGRGTVSGIAVREGTEEPTPFRVTPEVLNFRYLIPFVKARGTVTPRDSMAEALELSKDPNAVRHLFINRYKQVLKNSIEATSRQFTRGVLTLRGDISATTDAQFITAISQFSTLWGYNSAGFTAPAPMGASRGFFEFVAPASQTGSWQDVTKSVANRYYHQFVELSGPESFAAGFRSLITNFRKSGPPADVNLARTVLTDYQTVLDYANFMENRRIIVANKPNDPEQMKLEYTNKSTLAFKYDTGISGIVFDVYDTPDLDGTLDSDIRTLQGVMMAIDPTMWRRDTCNAALKAIAGMHGENFGTTLHTRAPYNPIPSNPGVFNLDTTFGWQHVLVGSPLGHWCAKGTYVTT
jgi:hypothetical protein